MDTFLETIHHIPVVSMIN